MKEMKILLLSDCNSVHTIKWAKGLSKQGLDIIIFSLGVLKVGDYQNTRVKVITAGNSVSRENWLDKLQYLKVLPQLKKVIEGEQPNIVHSHYATSYGLLGALSKFKPFVLSVWGADVFDFPKVSFLHRNIVKYNLKCADKILSTSNVMAKEIKLYTDKDIEVTPFGIDMEIFKPQRETSLFDEEDIVIGTVKTLEEKYGIRHLIDAFKILVDKYPEKPLKLLLVGGGSQEKMLKAKVKELGIEAKVVFTGQIPFDQVPKYHNMLSVSVSVSVSDGESFGVAIIEASACEKPVVVSNVGGLPEVVENGVTGIVVPPRNPQVTFEAIEKLLLDENLRKQMGKAGRERVRNLYDWNDNVQQMIGIYKEILK